MASARRRRPQGVDRERPPRVKSARRSGAGSDDRIWKALADPTRRRILDALRERPRTTGELADLHRRLSRFAVMKHLGVLQRAGLVSVEWSGRERWNHLNPLPIQQIHDRWVSRHIEPLVANVAALARHLKGKDG